MTTSASDIEALEALDGRLRTILPEEYQDHYEEVEPVSMGSAGLKYGADGRVAWNDMWASFCDLAMAGGPPHKGTLLEPASLAEIDAQPDRYAQVTDEICRGIILVSDLAAERSRSRGWVRVECLGEGMAQWMARAIVMENVAARFDGEFLELPAGPSFRLEKEIKNVVTVVAKTSHYWMGHIPRGQQRSIANLFARMELESALVVPPFPNDGPEPDPSHHLRVAADLQRETGLAVSTSQYAGWLGVECPTVRAAIWIMRALVVSNVLSRREGTVLFVPLNPASDPDGSVVVRALGRVHRLARARGIL